MQNMQKLLVVAGLSVSVFVAGAFTVALAQQPVEKPLPQVDEAGKPIEWIDDSILAKLRAIKPQQSYTISDVRSLLPKAGNFVSWLEGDVKRVYQTNSKAALDNVYGKGNVIDPALKGTEPVLVIESEINNRSAMPGNPGAPVVYAKGQKMQMIVDANTGHTMFTQQTYIRETPLSAVK
jgi:hypothetical protein